MAEAIIFDDVCTGASSDLKRATKVAREMVTQYGFSEVIGPVVYGGDDDEVFIGKDYGHTKNYSDTVAAEIDGEVRRLIEESYEQAKAILEAHIDQLHKLAEYLLEYEKIDSDDFEKFMKGEFTIEQKRQSEKKDAEEIGKIIDVTVGEEPKPEEPEQENGGFYK